MFQRMTTRAEQFREQEQRLHDSSHAKKAKAKAKVRKAHVAKAKLNRAAHATHNEADRAGSRSAYQLEPGTRKSSRAAANRSKGDSALRETATVRTSSPELRSGRKKEGGGAQRSRR